VRVADVHTGASGAATIVVDGGFSFIVDLDLLAELGLPPDSLRAGVELNEEAAALVRIAAETRKAELRGLALLARAEQSEYMLKIKLTGRGFSETAVCLALGRLKTAGYLDDERFARTYAASRLSRRRGGEGPATLEAALRRRGVDSAVAEAAIAAVLGPDERWDALVQAASEALRRSGGNKAVARARLRLLGFKGGEISECFERFDEGDSNTE